MTCAIGEGITICAPSPTEETRRILRCPDCKKHHRHLVRWYEWYAPDRCCGGCGRLWTVDGELWLYPFTPGWEAKRERQRNRERVRAAWGSR